jgi:hypothetical protein
MFQKLILETFFGGILELLASVDVHSGRETVQDPPSLPVGKQGWWLHVTTEQGQRAGAEGSSHGRTEGSMCGSPIFFPLSFLPWRPVLFSFYAPARAHAGFCDGSHLFFLSNTSGASKSVQSDAILSNLMAPPTLETSARPDA